MAPLKNHFLARAFGVGLVVGLMQFACQGPEEFFRSDGDLTGLGGSPPGTGGDGTGGELATGGFTGTGGLTGTGGTHTGGVTGTGGTHTGGVTGTGGTHTGGVTGTGGTHTGGVTGTGGTHTGGVTGTGGRATGGFTGTGGTHTGGVTGTGGRATGGFTGTGGRATGGVTGGGGKAGGSGAAGAVGTGPCAGLCTDPTEITTKSFSSGSVGTDAVCFESKVAIQGGNCSNVTAPRTFSINGKVEACGQNWPSVPAMVNGGYCYEFTAGQPDYSAFTTF